VIGQSAGQGDVSRGAAHESRADARRVPCSLIDTACNCGGGQQRRFEIDSRGTGTCSFGLAPAGVQNLKRAGKRSLDREGKVHIDGGTRAGGNRSDVHAVGKALRIRAELKNESGVVRRHRRMDISRAIIGTGIDADRALRLRISPDREKPGRQVCVGCGGRCRAW
jgi:hypothetical protein